MPTKDQVLEIGAGILAIRETTQGIRKSLGKEVKRDKAASKKKQGFLRRMFARKKKQDAEKIIEAKKKKNFMGKGVTAVAAAGKSFVERLFGAAGALLVGFLVVNLPKIIEEVEKIVDWLKGVKEWVDNFVDKVTEVSDVIINTVKEWISNIKEMFGFEEKKDEIEKQMEEGKKVAETLEKDWNADQERIKKDIENAKKEGERIVDGLPKSDQEVVAESNERVNQITALQEKRDSGEITQQQYEAEVDKLYQNENIGDSKESQILSNQIDRNELSPSEFFGTNQYGDGGTSDTNEEINTDLEKLDDKINLDSTNEKKDLSLQNNGEVNFVSTSKETSTENNEEPKVVVYHKFGETMRFSPPGLGVDGLTKEEAKKEFLRLHNKHPDFTGDEEFDYRALEIVLHDKFNVNTSSVQVEASEEFIQNMKKNYKPDEMNLISPTGGKTIVVPVDTSQSGINKNGTKVISSGSEEGTTAVVEISTNPIKKINQFNRHFV